MQSLHSLLPISWQAGRSNVERAIRSHGGYLMFAVLAAGLDAASTIHFMLLEGAEQELHPIVRLVSYACGPVLGPILGKLGQVAALLLLVGYRPTFTRLLCLLVGGLYAWAAWYNIFGR